MANPFAAPLTDTPFKPAQQKAAARVERTQRALPKQPTPNIPRIPNPTPTQTHAALTVAAHSQRQAIGPNASSQRIRSYQQELRQDPRNREYVQTLQHYARASEAHTAELLGRIHAGGGQGLASAQTPAGHALSRQEAESIGRGILASKTGESAADALRRGPGTSVLGTIEKALSGAGGSVANAIARATYGYNTTKKPGAGIPIAAVNGSGATGALTGSAQLLGGKPMLKAEALALALKENPIGTGRNTLESIPQTLNAMLTGTARLGIEGTIEGKPGLAFQQLVKGISTDANTRYGNLAKPGGVQADAKRIEHQGALPELLDASLAVGGPGAAIGKALTKGVEATGYGADALNALTRYREGLTQALQSPHPASPVAPKPGLADRLRATVNEAATKPRPNLRVAPGNEAPSPLPGAAVKPQERSTNLFQGLRQTAVDNSRRAATQKGLAAVKGVDEAIEKDPTLAGFLRNPKPPQQLAHDVKAGEVLPRLQKGGQSSRFPGLAFAGSAKEQRVGTSTLKSQAVEMRRAEAHIVTGQFEKLLKEATPEQRLLIVHAKEGTLPLHDAPKAVQALQEIHDQALEGSRDAAGRSMIPAADRRAGSDVAATTGRVLKHIEKHGGGSVFTPAFEKLVRALPDEKLTAHRDPSLSQDAIVSRRYRPQVQHLERWAKRHPNDPLARQTGAMTAQIKQLESEGGDLRAGRTGTEMTAPQRHASATQKYTTAHMLAQELAKAHGLPTDLAAVEHTKRLAEGNLVHTIGNRAPAVAHQMTGELARKGYRSTDAHLILNGVLKNLRNDYKTKFLKPWHDRYNVAPPGLTAHEAQEWLVASGRNPKEWQVAHLGKLRSSLAEDLNMEHAPNFNIDAEAHAVHTGNLLDQALGSHIPRSDVTKGAGVYPVAALNELKGVFSSPALPGRVLGKAKSMLSSLMLGTSLPWLTTMSGVTYPIQSLYGGAGAASLREAISFYHPLSATDKAAFDRWFGIDSTFEAASHGITSERIGATAPKGFEELARVTKLAKDFPLTKMFAKNRPDHLILRMERVPRRYARINVAYKGVKTQALREMLKETKGAMDAQSKFQLGLARLQHFGRRPAAEYIKAAMENQKFMEAHANHLNNILGEWKHMTQFERNVTSRMVLFYPWLRYSVKLAAKTLPKEHPLAYALALKYGTIQHEYLHELLGTDPTVGSVYLGPEQPDVAPEKRKFNVVGARQANPLLNTVADLLGAESPAQLVGVLPPYFSDLIEYAVGKNLFTDKGLKGADKSETTYAPGKRPNAARFALNRALATLNPGRTAMKVLGGGAPQSDESLPWSLKPVQYAPATLNKIKREHQELGSTPGSALVNELFPLLPHSDEGRIATKVRTEAKQAKEQLHKEHREHRSALTDLERMENGGTPGNGGALRDLERMEGR